MKPFDGLPFRVGTTSYILPKDILPNARFLAGQVKDVELVLFEVDDGPSSLPGEAAVLELGDLARRAGLTYTVHLPVDLRLGAEGGEQHASMGKARRAIECTHALDPWAYIVHLEGREERLNADRAIRQRWNDQAVRALEIAAGWAGGAERLAVENLEGYPLDFWDEALSRVPVSCCVDIGHLWLDGHDPLPFLARRLARTRVIHIHGKSERDHRSLRFVPADELARVMAFLVEAGYPGVLTIEVFGEEDYFTSVAALQGALQRLEKSI